ncbi:MAG: photosynthetic complex putative assembly protein PuhB [Pseudomonadota bacterium]
MLDAPARPAEKPDPDFDFERVPGLPEELPEGERVLWRGAPDWRVMARRVFLTRVVVWYFVALATLRALSGVADGAGAAEIAGAFFGVVPMALLSIGLLAGGAYVIARTTIYTITTRRVVLRYGIAAQITVNVPYSRVATAAAASYPDGSGELSLSLAGSDRFAYLLLWPHVRVWRFRNPEPSLRCVKTVAEPAGILAKALEAHHGENACPLGEAAAPGDAARADRPQPGRAGARGLATARGAAA